ncbi:MAG: translocation/assembly module TamB domain-containing protein [Muribaculaceae bacterium]|nr:translocation/assembly module TamB domain-containing protein [Muribaculaceae bacterium]
MTKGKISRLWKWFRATVSVVLVLAFSIPALLYVALSLPLVQNRIRTTAERELTALLGAPLRIGHVAIRPMSRLDLNDIALIDPADARDTLASIRTVSARFEMMYFLRTKRIIVDYALLEGVDVRLSRSCPGAPLNVQHVLDALKGDGKQKQPPHFDLRVSNVALLDGRFSYDVLSAPADSALRFDPQHIKVEAIELNAYIPRLSNDDYRVDIAHLSMRERSGFVLRQLEAEVEADSAALTVGSLSLKLPGTTLAFKPMTLRWTRLWDFEGALASAPLELRTMPLSTVCPADFEAFAPALSKFSESFSIRLDAALNPKYADIRELDIFDAGERRLLDLKLIAQLTAPADSGALPDVNVRELTLDANSSELAARMPGISPVLRGRLGVPGRLNVSAAGHLKSDGHAGLDARIRTSEAGDVELAAEALLDNDLKPRKADVDLKFDKLAIGALAGVKALGSASGELSAAGSWSGRAKLPAVKADLALDELFYRGTRLGDIALSGEYDGREEGSLKLTSDNRALVATLEAAFMTGSASTAPALLLDADIRSLQPELLGVTLPHEGSDISFSLHADLEGRDLAAMAGGIRVSDFRWTTAEERSLILRELDIQASPYSSVPFIKINSDLLVGEVKGRVYFDAIVPEIKDMLYSALPSLNKMQTPGETGRSAFMYDFELSDLSEVGDFFGLPVVPIYPVTVSGYVNAPGGSASVLVDAPYLRQGDKLISGVTVHGALDRNAGRATAYVTGEMPTKKGQMQIDANAMCVADKVSTHLDWRIRRSIPIEGSIDLAGLLRREADGSTGVEVTMNPGSITFGDDLWQIRPSKIDIAGNRISIDNFRLDSEGQHIMANGIVGAEDADSLVLGLENVSLLPIFETLEIDNALIGGRATGVFTARSVLSKEPDVSCPDLRVDSIGYNRCTLGNAHVAAAWDNANKAFTIDADIVEPEQNLHSRINGSIFPMSEALDIHFNAEHVRVGFMETFMSAFASDITGYASGHAHLFGTFKEIDMTGEIFAQDLGISIDITNTRYFATDSIILTPGRIEVSNITLHDRDGHTAKLNGTLTHTFFKAPVFDFRVSDAHELLCFNGTPKQNPDWYGTVYGNGGATIQGRPGVVDIGVNMTTTAGSAFTFVLSDRLDAEEYSFITFRNVTPVSAEDSLMMERRRLPKAVRELLSRRSAGSEEEASAYNMDINVAITPEARMTLVMDPVGGDEIRAYGEGNMRLAYHSIDNSINMWGNYTLERGSYNFTLQDIIIKDFTIKPGSTISFNGDPYAAEANLEAYYAVNANLSDLDESFLQDKELNRTNVPVHALMKVTGDIRQPDIDFDLEFPTLTQDTYRKVRSIVSTSDMMNRQIIYLLALNRFYTPDYMASTTKGSELFSVASSTISSQLSSMLGKLSENWSIAPNLRSDRGDFSDVEVDVALSSRLLNNRLLFNGNFGYRDKSLNTNQFIGDFDIEYLLNKRGSLRLKAYNRYNDQNYYLRTAQTTQGVGVMIRKDFDNIFSFLRRKPKAPAPEEAAADSTAEKRSEPHGNP